MLRSGWGTHQGPAVLCLADWCQE